jgi:hypothetical protein
VVTWCARPLGRVLNARALTLFEWIAANGEKIGLITVLLLAVAGGVTSIVREWLVPGEIHRRVIADKDKEIERARHDADIAEERSERLLAQLERLVRVTDDTISIAAVTQIRRSDVSSKDRRM